MEGYDGEPYLRFRADGTVQENQNSPAAYLNRNRYAGAEVPAAIQGDDRPPPAWKTVAHGGHHAWHDHRIHFMGKDPSVVAGLSEGRPVEWSGGVPFTVDGTPVVANGNYRLLDPPSPLPWIALTVVVTAAIVVAGRRRPVLVAGVALLVGGVAALGVGWAQNAAIPEGAGATPLTVVLPAVAILTALIAIARSSTPTGVIAALASAATTGGWVLTRYARVHEGRPPHRPLARARPGGHGPGPGHRHRRRGAGRPLRRACPCPAPNRPPPDPARPLQPARPLEGAVHREGGADDRGQRRAGSPMPQSSSGI